jgi:hypothetical protein
MPACCASFSLLRSRTTPAASVAAAATPKIAAALAVMPRPAAALLLSVLRPELRAHDRGSENSDDDRPFEHELERGRQVRERGPRPQADRVNDRERDRLDRDPAQDVPGRNLDVVLDRRGHGDRDLGEVRRDDEQDGSG